MKIVSALAFFAALLGASSASAEENCTISYANETFSLAYIPSGSEQSVRVAGTNDTYIRMYLSACLASTSDIGGGCGEGKFVGVTKDGENDGKTCVSAFDVSNSYVANKAYIQRVFRDSTNADNEFTLRIHCDPDAEENAFFSNETSPSSVQPSGNGQTYLVQFYSKSVCGNFEPSGSDEDDGAALKTGAIVGIVIGVVGVVVLGSVIYQWRSKASEEAKLQYTQLNN